MNLNQLLERAKDGVITEQELSDVANRLESGTRRPIPDRLLHILGRAHAVGYRSMIEKYLEDRSEPLLTKLALQILCSYWNETERYIAYVRQFAAGVPQDHANDIRLVALSIGGEDL